jgi:hypothetical protein
MLGNEPVGGQADGDRPSGPERRGEQRLVPDVKMVERSAEDGKPGPSHVAAPPTGSS